MAGCYQSYVDGDRFVILTTNANKSMQEIHNRMPLILEEDEINGWLFDEGKMRELLKKEPCLLEKSTEYEQQTLRF